MTSVSHGKPCAGNPHARFEEGASAPESPRRNALLHTLRMNASQWCIGVLSDMNLNGVRNMNLNIRWIIRSMNILSIVRSERLRI